MESYQEAKVQRIRGQYMVRETTKFDELKQLDKKVKTPASVFAYVFGSAGALVLGTGMSLAMKVIGNMMAGGIAIGVVGIALVSLTYPIYKAILQSRKKKYSAKIFELSDALLNK